MKLRKLLFLSLSIVLVLFSSCGSDESDDAATAATGIVLDQSKLSVAVDGTATLVASVLPKGADGTITWASSDASVASVSNGVVTGVKAGTANVTATISTFTATCVVTVSAGSTTVTGASLSGSAYYPIILDAITAEKLGDKIVADLRVDDASKFLFVWPDGTSYVQGTSVGPNFYGEVEGWVSLTVGTLGWSGAGVNIKSADNAAALTSLKAITDNPEGYYLHIGIKSKGTTTHNFILGGKTEIKFAVGASGFSDNGVVTPAITDFTRDGEWQEIEIPMTTLTGMGLSYSSFAADPNIFAFLSGGVTGTTLDLDAVFIYKK